MSDKHNEQILVTSRDLLFPTGKAFNGYHDEDHAHLLGTIAEQFHFTKRGPAETNPALKQLIPYVALARQTADGPVFLLYQRMKGSGEQRLHGNLSVGFGGHINPVDTDVAEASRFTLDFGPLDKHLDEFDGGEELSDILRNAITRELDEELAFAGEAPVVPLGFINDDGNEVGQVHLGLLCVVVVESEDVAAKETDGMELRGWHDLESLRTQQEKMETWSAFALEGLDQWADSKQGV